MCVLPNQEKSPKKKIFKNYTNLGSYLGLFSGLVSSNHIPTSQQQLTNVI